MNSIYYTSIIFEIVDDYCFCLFFKLFCSDVEGFFFCQRTLCTVNLVSFFLWFWFCGFCSFAQLLVQLSTLVGFEID